MAEDLELIAALDQNLKSEACSLQPEACSLGLRA